MVVGQGWSLSGRIWKTVSVLSSNFFCLSMEQKHFVSGVISSVPLSTMKSYLW